MATKRIAVVSTDNVHVNDHFGMAEAFLIYDLEDGPQFVEMRPVTKLSVGDPNHGFDPERFGRIADTLKDCAQVYMIRIGKVPAQKLRERGIEPVTYEGLIEKIA